MTEVPEVQSDPPEYGPAKTREPIPADCVPFHGVEQGIVFNGGGLTLRVVSTDSALLATCQDVLRSLVEAGTFSGRDNLSVCLWDFSPDDEVDLKKTQQSLAAPDGVYYIVPPAHLNALRAQLPDAEGNILLKPVTRLILRALLEALASSRSSNARATREEIGALRANRDEILQHLLHANLRLQEYDQQRTNFIARAVHDFQAPLTALSGFCGLLAGGELGPLTSIQREATTRMESSIQRISRMASAMFELNAGPSLSRKPDLREGDIMEPIRQALHEITPQAKSKHVELRANNIEPPSAPLYFEASQIEQVLVNLLDNAWKFVPKHGFIEVRGYSYFWERRGLTADMSREEKRKRQTSAPNCYRIDIVDNGPGVPRHLLESIFEEYTSYSGSQDRSGGGLGLAICRLIIGRHQGHVWAESGNGVTVFSFVLPYRKGSRPKQLNPAVARLADPQG